MIFPLIMPLKRKRCQGRVLFLDTRIEVCFGLIFSFSHGILFSKNLEQSTGCDELVTSGTERTENFFFTKNLTIVQTRPPRPGRPCCTGLFPRFDKFSINPTSHRKEWLNFWTRYLNLFKINFRLIQAKNQVRSFF